MSARWQVTVRVDDGREPWTTEVEALDEWKARTRAMMAYPGRLSGESVEYDVRKVMDAHDLRPGTEFVGTRLGRAGHEHTTVVWTVEQVITRHRDGTATIKVAEIRSRWRTPTTVELPD